MYRENIMRVVTKRNEMNTKKNNQWQTTNKKPYSPAMNGDGGSGREKKAIGKFIAARKEMV